MIYNWVENTAGYWLSYWHNPWSGGNSFIEKYYWLRSFIVVRGRQRWLLYVFRIFRSYLWLWPYLTITIKSKLRCNANFFNGAWAVYYWTSISIKVFLEARWIICRMCYHLRYHCLIKRLIGHELVPLIWDDVTKGSCALKTFHGAFHQVVNYYLLYSKLI